ncbi:phosphoribosylglycinamide formyltransferase, partial [Bacteroidota bacterium]
LSNKEDTYVLKRAKRLGIKSVCFNKTEFSDPNHMLPILHQYSIDFIILAGFLWLVPVYLIRAYRNKIINIHPALLPKYGGKGMYGLNVHRAVKENKEKESGVSIHIVNEEYDKGEIIFQARCPIDSDDTPEMIAEKVHKLEYQYFPRVIEEYVLKNH